MHHHPTRDEVWLYGRNSTDEQRQEATINSQRDAVHRDTAAKGEQISREFIDEARSGFTLVRPALDQLREAARAPGCRCRVVRIYDKSRLARRAVLRHIVEDELAQRGIAVEYVSAPLFDDSAEGRFAEGVIDQLDEYFAVKLAENLRRGRYYDIRAGHVWWAPYAYRLVVVPGQEWPAVVIDEELRPIVREVYERIIAGESAGLVARSLNMRAIPSPAMVLAQRQGKEVRQIAWSQRTIWEMVQNPYYAGEAAYDRRQRTLPERVKKRYRNKEKSSDRARAPEDWVRASVPAIVSEAEQQAAKEALQRGRKYSPRNTKGQYLLRGLLRCPLCGKRLASRREHPGTPKEWRYYRCTTLHQLPGSTRTRTCPTRVVAKEVEPLVVEYLAGCLEDEEALRAAFLELRSSPERERGQWEARLADLAAQEERARSRLRGAQEMREDGEYTAAEFAERKAQLTEEIAALRREMAEVQGYLGQARHQEGLWVSLEAFCREMAGRLRESEGPECFPQRQRTVQALVDAIDVHPERFDVEGVFGAALERSASMGR